MLLPVSDPVCSPVGPSSTALGMGLPHGNWLALVALPWAVSKRQFNFFFLFVPSRFHPGFVAGGQWFHPKQKLECEKQMHLILWRQAHWRPAREELQLLSGLTGLKITSENPLPVGSAE